jgi:hypothetical protein
MDDLKMTRFKAMTMDEQEEKIEQSSQKALKSREEIKVVEATEVQNKGLSMTSEAQEREFLLME